MDSKRFFVYVRSYPRAIALVPTHALSGASGTFLVVSTLGAGSGSSAAAADDSGDVHISLSVLSVPSDLQQFAPLDMDSVYGIAGLLDYQGDTYIFLITQAQAQCDLGSLDGRTAGGQTVYRVQQTVALSLTDNIYDSPVYRRMPGAMHDDYHYASGDGDMYGVANPCAAMCGFLGSGAFYFAPSFDVTRTQQSQCLRAVLGNTHVVHDPDAKFQWNNSLLRVFGEYREHVCGAEERRAFDLAGYAVSLVEGSVEAWRGDGVAVFVVSRSSSMRSGMRFLTRGVDDEGGVANEVETEVVVRTAQTVFAHVQVRGSVPVFWTQDGVQLGAHRVRITRSVRATLPATKRHFADLLARYGRVCAVSLLRTPGPAAGEAQGPAAGEALEAGSSEAALGRFYRAMVDAMRLPEALVGYQAFDYNGEVRGGNFDRVQTLVRRLAPALAGHRYFLAACGSGPPAVLALQRGVQRTNCIDCLDRTNVVQSVISRSVVGEYLRHGLSASAGARQAVLGALAGMWAANGDRLARVYAGTGALKADVTASGRSGWAGFLSDASKSLSRLVQGSFQDRGKQSTIDLLLGAGDSALVCRPLRLHDPYTPVVMRALERHLPRIGSARRVRGMLCTYNMHGRAYDGRGLGSWLAMPKARAQRPDFVAVAFQEIVPLDVQSVVSADPANRRTWERTLAAELNRQHRRALGDQAEGEYALVSSEQLVGVALLFFAHESLLPSIHGLQMVKHKTGLGGMAGTKGCVAMHAMLNDTSICLVAAHLAAGATNVAERNADFHAIRRGLRFRHGRRIDDHDCAVWLGDLNYRIDLPNDQARLLITQGLPSSLMMYDQLSMQMASGAAFAGYAEMPIAFAPTYKFDPGTDTYDTSEKMRVPSWTDRIVYRGGSVRMLTYYRDEIRLSDHKPVLGMAEVDVVEVDKGLRRQIVRELYARRHASTENVEAVEVDVEAQDAELIDLAEPQGRRAPPVPPQRSKPGARLPPPLPPPSSNTQAWWDGDVPPGKLLPVSGHIALVNPFAPQGATIDRSAATLPSDQSKTPSPSPPSLSEEQQPQLIDMDSDPFADDGDGISWEPIQPI
ncbi:Inositol-1,4,5-trisphosphate 5-phosphatase 1 [Coemansia erecta]|uniref:phosphoinositide 5-phosphatase n=1 Tax=Coemansia erecta TaxID=147472 RepID=A0A9W7XZG8_9FUNG|nr:Inositol-1,4,5-trisphosphate 5-phosphatase 1 [Coemansia erecta]